MSKAEKLELWFSLSTAATIAISSIAVLCYRVVALGPQATSGPWFWTPLTFLASFVVTFVLFIAVYVWRKFGGARVGAQEVAAVRQFRSSSLVIAAYTERRTRSGPSSSKRTRLPARIVVAVDRKRLEIWKPGGSEPSLSADWNEVDNVVIDKLLVAVANGQRSEVPGLRLRLRSGDEIGFWPSRTENAADFANRNVLEERLDTIRDLAALDEPLRTEKRAVRYPKNSAGTNA